MTETIRAWKDDGDPTYIVQVGNDMYEMSDDADMPNGVCIYRGEVDSKPWSAYGEPADSLPVGIVRAIVRKVQIDGDVTA